MSTTWQVPQLTSDRVLQQLLKIKIKILCLHTGGLPRLVEAQRPLLPSTIHRCGCLVAQRLMQALMIVKVKYGLRPITATLGVA